MRNKIFQLWFTLKVLQNLGLRQTKDRSQEFNQVHKPWFAACHSM